jgi:hypothetical protein
MRKFEDGKMTTSTTASFPTSGQKSTLSKPRKLWVEYHDCGCTFNFRKKYFGLAHWWKFTRLRLRGRKFRTSIEIYTKGHLYHGEVGDSETGVVKRIPSVSMTNTEYDHWFEDE